MKPPVHWKTLPVKASVQGWEPPDIVPPLNRTVPVPAPLESVPWKWAEYAVLAVSWVTRLMVVPAAPVRRPPCRRGHCQRPPSCRVPELTATVVPGVLFTTMFPSKSYVPVPADLRIVPVLV